MTHEPGLAAPQSPRLAHVGVDSRNCSRQACRATWRCAWRPRVAPAPPAPASSRAPILPIDHDPRTNIADVHPIYTIVSISRTYYPFPRIGRPAIRNAIGTVQQSMQGGNGRWIGCTRCTRSRATHRDCGIHTVARAYSASRRRRLVTASLVGPDGVAMSADCLVAGSVSLSSWLVRGGRKLLQFEFGFEN